MNKEDKYASIKKMSKDDRKEKLRRMKTIKCTSITELKKTMGDFLGVPINQIEDNLIIIGKDYDIKVKLKEGVYVAEKTETRWFAVEPPAPPRTPKKDELWLCGSKSRLLYSTGEQDYDGRWTFYPCGTNSLTSHHLYYSIESYTFNNIKPACQKCGAEEETCEHSEVTK